MTMQRDMKVGIAVGVALVGIVGALFFRREPEAKDKDVPPPRLQDVEEIDRRIVEKPRGPYMNGVEDFPDKAAPVPPPRSAQAKPKSRTDDAPAIAKQTEPSPATPGVAPDPIQPPHADSLASDNVPSHNRAWEPAGTATKKPGDGQRSNPSGTAGGTGRTHVIRPGDTLSGIAAHYLGSSARYREIYEANRKVLKSPDDLPDGVTIVIPDAAKPRDPQHTAKSGSGAPSESQPGAKARTTTSRGADSQTEEQPAATPPRSDGSGGKLRFVPVKRGPFSAGRSQPPAESSKSDDSP
jgi:phage tail protein X